MSKFKDLLAARQGVDFEAEPEPETTPANPEKRSPGRPRTGKRSNPDFGPVTVYIRRDTHKRVKLALLEQEQPQEFSELVEILLVDWLYSRI